MLNNTTCFRWGFTAIISQLN